MRFLLYEFLDKLKTRRYESPFRWLRVYSSKSPLIFKWFSFPKSRVEKKETWNKAFLLTRKGEKLIVGAD